MSNEELASFFYGCGYKAYLVEGSDELLMHKKMASTMDAVINDIKEVRRNIARIQGAITAKANA